MDLSSLDDALVDAGLAPTPDDDAADRTRAAGAYAPESGVQTLTTRAVDREAAPPRDVLPWAAHMAAALAPTLLAIEVGLLRTTPDGRRADAGDELAARGRLAMTDRPRPWTAPAREIVPPPPSLPALTVLVPAHETEPRRVSPWPVRLCGLIAFAAATTAFVAAPHPASARVRSELGGVTRAGTAASASLKEKLRSVLNDV